MKTDLGMKAGASSDEIFRASSSASSFRVAAFEQTQVGFAALKRDTLQAAKKGDVGFEETQQALLSIKQQ
jgi:hypothetical protein